MDPANLDGVVCLCVLSCVRLFATSWTIAHQAPLSKEFSRQEYWNGLPFPTPGDLPNPGIKLCLFHLLCWQADSLPAAPPEKPLRWCCCCQVASVVSDSVRPHRRQPTRLRCPGDSPGKNTGVGCHCLLHRWCYLALKFI